MPDPLAGWVKIPTDIPGHLGTAIELYKHKSGARLALFDGWSDDKAQKRVWWWALHYRRFVRETLRYHKRLNPPFGWANDEIKNIEAV